MKWKEQLDRQLDITFRNGELHPAQVGQLTKFISTEIIEKLIAEINSTELRLDTNQGKHALTQQLRDKWL